MDNIIGKKYNHWTILNFSHKDKFNHPFYLCQCDCGNKKVVDFYALKYGLSKRCKKCCYQGQDQKINVRRRNKYGKLNIGVTNLRQYTIYHAMKQRCYNEKSVAYKHYGARGIKTCEEWRDNFLNFYNWSLNNGYSDDLTIDRIDYNGDYTPHNCRWVDVKTRSNNKRSNHFIKYNGVRYTISTFCKNFKLNEQKIRHRINVFKIENPELLLKEDLRGRKQTKYFATINGITKGVCEWCDDFGLKYYTIIGRITKYGYTTEEALTKKLKNGKSNPFLTE